MPSRTPYPAVARRPARNPTEALYPGLWRDLAMFLDPGQGVQGGRLLDWSPWRNHAALTAITAADWQGGALAFDGSTQYGTVANSSSFAFNARGLTVSAWVAVAGISNREIITKALGSGSFAGFTLRVSLSATFEFWPYNSGGSAVLGTTTPAVGELYHVAATHDLSNCRIYVNGKLENTQASTVLADSSADLLVGGDNPGWTGSSFWGWLGRVGVWNRPLDAREVALLASGISPLTPRPRAAVGKAPAAGVGPPKFLPEQLGVSPMSGIY